MFKQFTRGAAFSSWSAPMLHTCSDNHVSIVWLKQLPTAASRKRENGLGSSLARVSFVRAKLDLSGMQIENRWPVWVRIRRAMEKFYGGNASLLILLFAPLSFSHPRATPLSHFFLSTRLFLRFNSFVAELSSPFFSSFLSFLFSTPASPALCTVPVLIVALKPVGIKEPRATALGFVDESCDNSRNVWSREFEASRSKFQRLRFLKEKEVGRWSFSSLNYRDTANTSRIWVKVFDSSVLGKTWKLDANWS